MKANKRETIFSKLSSNAFKSFFDLGLKKRSYKQLHTILFTTMCGMAMLPLLLVGGLGYYNYQDLLQASEQEQLEWQLDGSINSIEHMVESLKIAIQFASTHHHFLELLSGEQLEQLYSRIQSHYPVLADLGVIDQRGIQQMYYGSYDLQGTNYSDEEWFQNIFGVGVYVSDVYKGHRGVPHFAIAVGKYDPTTQSRWVLRATINATALQQFTNTIKPNATDDLFLVDNQGKLQTSSLYFGEILSQFEYPIEPGIQHSVSENGEHIFKAVGAIKGSPWNLVLVKKRYIHHNDWKNFQLRLVLIIIASLALCLVITLNLVRVLTNLIRKSDETQMAMVKEAEHTNKLASIGRLAAGVGHEINNPLAIINQKIGLLEDILAMSEADFEHRDTIQNSLRVVNKSVDRCKAITHRLLGFARRTDVYSEQLDINEIILEVIQFLDNAMLYNRIKLELDLDDDLPSTISDRLQLQQIFLNIINNAIDAIGKNGLIKIRSQRAAPDLRITIEDSGPGIAADVLPNIFEPFYTTKEQGKGTGLGLSITYGLIKKLGGDIAVESRLGHGTVFTITIPIKNQNNDEKQ
jgi:two-component system NtrC family sensor kinase